MLARVGRVHDTATDHSGTIGCNCRPVIGHLCPDRRTAAQRRHRPAKTECSLACAPASRPGPPTASRRDRNISIRRWRSRQNALSLDELSLQVARRDARIIWMNVAQMNGRRWARHMTTLQTIAAATAAGAGGGSCCRLVFAYFTCIPLRMFYFRHFLHRPI